MENDVTFYFKRKRCELELLRGALTPESSATLSARPYWMTKESESSFERVLKSKAAWRSHFLADYHYSRANFTETSVSPPLLPEEKVHASDFTYQRFDLRHEAKCFLRLLYGPWQGTARSPGLFTSSGMSSITSVLSACRATLGSNFQVYLRPDAFFETQSFIQLFLPEARISDDVSRLEDGAVVLIDSIGTESHVDALRSIAHIKPSLVIFDTTCYDRDDERIKFAIDHCSRHQWPLYLVRSHLKLDCLGIELGRLGSIVAVLPEEDPSLFRFVSNFLSLAGQNYTPASVFPLLSDPTALALGKARNQLIRQNTRHAAQTLSERLGRNRVRTFHHELFLAINLNEQEFDETNRKQLAMSLMELGLPVRAASSFGFDFVALDQFRDRHVQTPTLRVAFADLPNEHSSRFCDEIAKRFGA